VSSFDVSCPRAVVVWEDLAGLVVLVFVLVLVLVLAVVVNESPLMLE